MEDDNSNHHRISKEDAGETNGGQITKAETEATQVQPTNQILDQEIRSKRQGRSNTSVPAKPGAYASSNLSNNDDTISTSATNKKSNARDLEADIITRHTAAASQSAASQMEQDILTKQLGQRTSTPSSITTQRPGAHSAKNISKNPKKPDINGLKPSYDQSGVRNLEADVLVKYAAAASRGTTSQLEQDVIAKQLGRSSIAVAKPGAFDTESVSGPGNLASSTTPTHSYHPSAVRNLEADILAKRTAAASGGTATQLEQDIIAKRSGGYRTPAAKPGALDAKTASDSGTTNTNMGYDRSDVRQLEADVRAKQLGRSTNIATGSGKLNANTNSSNNQDDVRKLEADIIAKVKVSDQEESFVPASMNRDCSSRGYAAEAIGKIESEKRLSETKSSGLEAIDIEDLDALIDVKQEIIASLTTSSPESESGGRKVVNDDKDRIDYFADDESGLAVAVAVEEYDGDHYLPSAVEFDPDAKPPMYRNRRFRLYMIFLFSAAIIIACGATLGILLTTGEEQPTIPYRATLGIREFIELAIKADELDDFTGPYRQALDWIIFVDRMELSPENATLFQRYILAYFYFATSQKESWNSGCAPSDTFKDECSVDYLLEREMSNEPESMPKQGFRWLSHVDECKWAGVSCDNFNQVIAIDFGGGIQKANSFPEGVTLLPYLHEITLNYIGLEGLLPTSLWSMKHLSMFSATGNQLGGTISDQLYESRSLSGFWIAHNNITGMLTTNIKLLHDIKIFRIGNNQLTGTIPDEIGDLRELRSIELYKNMLTGSIPPSLGNARYMFSLSFGQNLLTGPIPDMFQSYRDVNSINFDSNLLTGTIPESIYEIEALQSLDLSNNMLTGTISNKIAKATFLIVILLQNNNLTGDLPYRYGKSSLEIIEVQGNNFNGTVPTQLCDLVQRGQITTFVLDCQETSNSDVQTPEIICPPGCCTACCNRDGELCTEIPP